MTGTAELQHYRAATLRLWFLTCGGEYCRILFWLLWKALKHHLAPKAANIQLKPTVANYMLYWQTGRQVGRVGGGLPGLAGGEQCTAHTQKPTDMDAYRDAHAHRGWINADTRIQEQLWINRWELGYLLLLPASSSVRTHRSGEQGVAGRPGGRCLPLVSLSIKIGFTVTLHSSSLSSTSPPAPPLPLSHSPSTLLQPLAPAHSYKTL